MPPPRRVPEAMFSGCPSVCPSVHHQFNENLWMDFYSYLAQGITWGEDELVRFLINLLNPKTAGGGGLNQPPPRHFPRPFRRAKFFDRAAH